MGGRSKRIVVAIALTIWRLGVTLGRREALGVKKDFGQVSVLQQLTRRREQSLHDIPVGPEVTVKDTDQATGEDLHPVITTPFLERINSHGQGHHLRGTPCGNLVLPDVGPDLLLRGAQLKILHLRAQQ